ncbi:MAG: DUF72 domain-containing protein [Syntrophobacteraceae bacterium]
MADKEIERYLFRRVHPLVSIGTASDRYSGWIGQIYTEELYKERISTRTNRVGKKSFRPEVLPVDCVREYYQHFRILEIDYTFYAPMLDKGMETPCARTLAQYLSYMRPRDHVFLKVPQMFFAQKVWRGKNYLPNENYLAPAPFISQFYEPAVNLLGPNLKGIIFEQEYQLMGERIPPIVLAGQLNEFFSAIPMDTRYHVELRTEAYLCNPVFDVLRKHGVGYVLSHWTWLPNLKKQYSLAGGRFIGAGGQALVRLMTPIGMRYEDAYAKAFPFDRLLDEMIQPGMISQTAKLMWECIEQEIEINVVINNRAGGNAPRLAQKIVKEFIEMGKGKSVGNRGNQHCPV